MIRPSAIFAEWLSKVGKALAVQGTLEGPAEVRADSGVFLHYGLEDQARWEGWEYDIQPLAVTTAGPSVWGTEDYEVPDDRILLAVQILTGSTANLDRASVSVRAIPGSGAEADVAFFAFGDAGVTVANGVNMIYDTGAGRPLALTRLPYFFTPRSFGGRYTVRHSLLSTAGGASTATAYCHFLVSPDGLPAWPA